jgi:hypothetical protein
LRPADFIPGFWAFGLELWIILSHPKRRAGRFRLINKLVGIWRDLMVGLTNQKIVSDSRESTPENQERCPERRLGQKRQKQIWRL